MFELKECENLMINKELIEHKGKRRLCVAPMLDGKELYVERRQYVKTDAAMKDKIIAHQKKCGQTAQAYLDARNALPSNQTYQQHQAAIEQLKRRFEAEFDELEKEIKCNGKPTLLF